MRPICRLNITQKSDSISQPKTLIQTPSSQFWSKLETHTSDPNSKPTFLIQIPKPTKTQKFLIQSISPELPRYQSGRGYSRDPNCNNTKINQWELSEEREHVTKTYQRSPRRWGWQWECACPWRAPPTRHQWTTHAWAQSPRADPCGDEVQRGRPDVHGALMSPGCETMEQQERE